MAEVAFSVSKAYQGLGIANILQKKLATAAKNNGIKGLIAYTSPENKGMIGLFQKLPYKIKKERDEDMVILNCLFSELSEKKEFVVEQGNVMNQAGKIFVEVENKIKVGGYAVCFGEKNCTKLNIKSNQTRDHS